MDAKTKILEACQWARDKGLKIVPNEWSVFQSAYSREWKSENGQCCPLGAVLLKEQPEEHQLSQIASVARELDVSLDWIDMFTAGVDDRAYSVVHDAVEFGRAVIRQFSDFYALPEGGKDGPENTT